MALTEAQRRANDKYLAQHYKQLAVRYPSEFAEEIKAAAEAAGESLAGYIRQAIEERMARDAAHGDSTLDEIND